MPSPAKTQQAYLVLALVMLMWAGNSIIGRAVRDDIPPFTLSFIRWVGAFCIVAPIALRYLRADWPAMKASAGLILFYGIVGIAGFNGFLYTGLHFTAATNALLVQAAIPAVVLLVDFLFFRARPASLQLLGVAVSTFGVGVVVTRADLHVLATLRFGVGDLLVFGGVICWALYTALLRLRPAMQPFSFLAATFLVGAITMAPLAAGEWNAAHPIRWRPELFAALAYVAVFPSVVAYALYNFAVVQIGPGRAGQAISLMPLFGAGLAALLLGETLHRYHLTGMVLILGGIAITAVMRTGASTAR